jgi:hypothetical protein
MYLERWDDAIADFENVKTSGHALFTTGSNAYFQLFKQANEQSDEMIFSIQNIGQSGYGSSVTKFCGTRSTFGSDWNTFLVSPDVVDLYENADGSKFEWDLVLPGYSSMTPAQREVFFLRDGLTDAEKTAAATRGADMTQYLPVGNEARILAAYQNRDPRLAANVITPYSSYKGSMAGADVNTVSRWPFRNQNSPVFDLQTDTRNFFFYLHRKFVPEGTSETPDRAYGPIDYPVIRYADVLLLWAEALNENEELDAAIEKVNEVRARAGVGLLNSSVATTESETSGEGNSSMKA